MDVRVRCRELWAPERVIGAHSVDYLEKKKQTMNLSEKEARKLIVLKSKTKRLVGGGRWRLRGQFQFWSSLGAGHRGFPGVWPGKGRLVAKRPSVRGESGE